MFVNKSIFLAASLILLLSPLSAHAQAAAESALTNALSSSATVKAGSSLGSALNQGAARMGVREENTARSPRLGLQQNSTSTHLTTQVRTSQSGINQIRPSQPSNNLHIGSTPTTGGLYPAAANSSALPTDRPISPRRARTTRHDRLSRVAKITTIMRTLTSLS